MHCQGVKIVPGETTTPTGKHAVREVQCPNCNAKYRLWASPGMTNAAIELDAEALRRHLASQSCSAHTDIVRTE